MSSTLVSPRRVLNGADRFTRKPWPGECKPVPHFRYSFLKMLRDAPMAGLVKRRGSGPRRQGPVWADGTPRIGGASETLQRALPAAVSTGGRNTQTLTLDLLLASLAKPAMGAVSSGHPASSTGCQNPRLGCCSRCFAEGEILSTPQSG